MIDLAWKNMWMRKGRSILTIVGVAIALQLVILITTIVTLTVQDLEGELAKYAGKMYVKSASSLLSPVGEQFPPLDSTLDEAEARQILAEAGEGVNRARSSPVLFRQLMPPIYPGGPSVIAVGIEPGREKAYMGEEIKAKEGLAAFAPESRGEVIMGEMAASFFKVDKVGEQVEIMGEKLRVAGILEQPGEMWDRVSSFAVLLPLGYAQELFNARASVSAVLLSARSPGEVEAVAEGIRVRHPKLDVMTQKEIAKNMDQVLAGEKTFMSMINNTVYAVAGAVILVVMVMAVTERTREIGTLRALGASRRLVLSTVVIEAMMLALISGILSLPLAWVVARYVMGGLEQAFRGSDLLRVILTGVVLAGLFSLYPAFRATRVNPVEALHYE